MKPDMNCLYEIAESQRGYFTTAQAGGCGYSWALLSHHASGGKLVRMRRGLYRFRQYPSSPREEVMAAWLAAGSGAVVSHESALDLLDLADVIPDAIHVTIPRSRRSWKAPGDVTPHTSHEALPAGDTVERDGIRLTSPVRTILDVALDGTSPDQVIRAIRLAIDRGVVTRSQLLAGAKNRGRRVERLVAGAVGDVPG
ncbi:MAG: type IV toxin-antitoxin system AbiEi family antitoxin domain-containing protein [Candidatus Dormibacteria bacterium]